MPYSRDSSKRQNVPKILRDSCFEFNLSDVLKNEFQVKCKICSESVIGKYSNNLRNIYAHNESKRHKTNQAKIRSNLLKNERLTTYENATNTFDCSSSYSLDLDKISELNFSEYKNLKQAEDHLAKIKRDVNLYKENVEHLTKIKLLNEREIQNLRNQILNSNHYDNINELKNKIHQIELENIRLKSGITKTEESLLKSIQNKDNIEEENQRILNDNFQLSFKISNFNEMLQELKQELDLKSNIDNLDEFEKELSEVIQLVKAENKLLKERLVEYFISN